MSDCTQVITMNHKKGKDIAQFSSKYIQAQIAAFEKSKTNHKLMSAITITCISM